MKTFTFRYSPNEPSISQRLSEALKGKPYVRPHELVSKNLKALLQIATESRLELFGMIVKEKPNSIYELAGLVKKDQSYVLREIRTLEALGLVRLIKEEDGGRERLRPEALYSKIVIDCGFEEPRKKAVND